MNELEKIIQRQMAEGAVHPSQEQGVQIQRPDGSVAVVSIPLAQLEMLQGIQNLLQQIAMMIHQQSGGDNGSDGGELPDGPSGTIPGGEVGEVSELADAGESERADEAGEGEGGSGNALHLVE